MAEEKSPTAGSSPPQPHPPPPLLPPTTSTGTPRRSLSTRACDRCRRRKAKCNFSAGVETCSNCQDVDEKCSFDLPLAKRGPKPRRRSALSALPPESPLPENLPPPPVPWEDGGSGGGSGSLAVDPALTPRTIYSSVSDPATAHTLSALQRWHNLSRALAFQGSLDQIVTRCFDLFFEYLYPLTPLVHEPSLRDALSFFAQAGFSPASNPTPGSGFLETWPDATFTLVTAVCAKAAFLLPKDLFPEGESIAETFLQASRNCLNNYLEADLESPNANSIAIRYFHSNCLHAAGKPKYSWHIFGEATRLAQVMQLHEESSLEGLFPIEAELRRRAFWIVYMGDKSAAILNNRPITIHKFSFETGITTAYPTGIEDESSIGLSPANATAPESTRKTFIAGFNANLRLWQTASDLLLEIRLLQDQEQKTLSAQDKNRIDSLYIRFITCLDDLPPYLQSYTFAAIAGGGKEATTNQFIIQCANLQVSMHCLRMVITQKFEDISYFSPGIEQSDLRKTEIARDMLRVCHEAPFWSLQVNGEPYVEKIRLIGASLLAIIHRNRNSPVAARARGDFAVLLDILTRLDSKASDALRNNSNWVI